MPVRYTLESDYVLLICEGDFDLPEIRTQCEEIAKVHASKPLLRILVQDRESSFNPSTEELKHLALMLTGVYRNLPVRIAVHVDDDVHFGMARMLGAFADSSAIAYDVFRDREAAECWLLGKPYPPTT